MKAALERAPNLYRKSRGKKNAKNLGTVVDEAMAATVTALHDGHLTAEGMHQLVDEAARNDILKGPPLSPEIEAMELPKRLLNDIWMVWCVIDRDHNNELSSEELAQALAAFGMNLDHYEIEDMLREVPLSATHPRCRLGVLSAVLRVCCDCEWAAPLRTPERRGVSV